MFSFFMYIQKMSVESIEAKITEVLGVYDGIPETKKFAVEMYDEISQIKPLYEVNGLALLRAANAINMVCDKAVIVEKYVEKYYTEFGIGTNEKLYTSMHHLHDEIRRLKHRL
jgi:hypothetical protein